MTVAKERVRMSMERLDLPTASREQFVEITAPRAVHQIDHHFLRAFLECREINEFAKLCKIPGLRVEELYGLNRPTNWQRPIGQFIRPLLDCFGRFGRAGRAVRFIELQPIPFGGIMAGGDIDTAAGP